MKEKLWNCQFVSLFIVNTINSFGFYMILSILSKYLIDSGIILSLAGVIVGMFSITSLIIRPICGMLSDRLNKVKLLLFSLVLESIGVFGYAAVVNVPMIMAARTAHGIGFGIVSTVLVALATDYIPKSRIGEGIGYLGISQVISSAVAPGLGIELAGIIGYKAVFQISCIFSCIGFLIVCLLYKKLGLKEKVRKELKRSRMTLNSIIATEVLGYTAVAAAFSFINGIITSFLLLFAEERGITSIGIYYTVCAICLFVFKPFSGKLVDRKGIAMAVYPAIIMTGVSMFILSRSTGIAMIVVSGILKSIGQGTAMPALQAECIKRAGKNRSGVATSTYYLGGDVVQGIGPMIGGAAVGMMGYQLMFDGCGMILLSMIVLFFLVEKKNHRVQDVLTEN
ncbi:MAG: MFS transporter [Lachnospiraceae bacterium]|nr:MFS transporter [Lachnospiraceae bacterium]